MRVIITGAAGRIGREITEELFGSHELCLLDRCPVPRRTAVVADLAQPGVIRGWKRWFTSKAARWGDAFAGADVVLHLAAHPRPLAPWEGVIGDNIHATWHVMQAAIQHRVPRVVFASSNWAVKALEQRLAPACYRPDGPKIGSDVPPCPLTAYGISKAFGEITGRAAVDEQHLRSFVAVRIGAYPLTRPVREEGRRLWIGTRDLRCLLRRCVEAEFAGFHVVYGVSAQTTAPYELSHTRRLLSWEPEELL